MTRFAAPRHTVPSLMTLAEQIELACLMEATARKPGNVHPGARFDDLSYDDFARAAASLGPCFEHSQQQGHMLGETILRAVQATRFITDSNANLGIILLLAPLVSAPHGTSLHAGVPKVLLSTTVRDAELVYEAIRLARPGGLGEVRDQDVGTTPTISLREAMSLAADRDSVARQYVTHFEDVATASAGLHGLWMGLSVRNSNDLQHHSRPAYPLWELAVIRTACDLMAKTPDSLIARKCGVETARQAASRAAGVLDAQWPFCDAGEVAMQQFDAWLRADGHRRNPGTTADLIAACLFWAIREGYIQPPTKAEVLDHARRIAVNHP
jgi:triphosphoribosyl-dephospho-CoA synthase